jgi:2,4-dienoyl-CoA reductase-like NADH-dependent reductase (Old Yellow Enzyme family)
LSDSPISLRSGVALRNRIALAPLTNTQSHADGLLSEVEARWLLRRAGGGFGLVSTCAAFVSEEGKAWPGQLGIATDAHGEALRGLAAGLRDAGAVGVVQLHHGGAKAELAPTRLSTVDADGQRAATAEDIERVVADFVAAARRAEAAGFDGVEVHGANGYLFTQFLAPADNPREDAWGGSLEGRARFLRQAVRAVRAAVSDGFAVGVRLSPIDLWDRRGLVLEDSVQVARWLADDGVDWVHLSLMDAGGPPPGSTDAPPVARAFRDALPPEVLVFAAGGIRTRADAARAWDAGVDVAVLGRAGIAHPDWPRASLQPGFEMLATPWPREHLRSVDVGEAFLAYLGKMAGLVEGGAPPRG